MFSGGLRATLFFTWWLIWAGFHSWFLSKAGFKFEIVVMESAASTVLLALMSSSLGFTMKYYRPADLRASYLLIWALILTAIWLGVTKVSVSLISNGASLSYESFFSETLPLRAFFGFLVLGSFIVLNYLWYAERSKRDQEQARAVVEKQAKESELVSLRQQLQPHFLFNTLNSINALITSKPEEARKMTIQLSEFLRGTLTREGSKIIPLEQEFHHLQLYLDIEKVRFGHRLKVVVDADEQSKNMQIPSLLLQPLVENAIKFGLYDTLDDVEIVIRARRTSANNLQVLIENPYDPDSSGGRKGTGFGLSSVKRRLFLLYSRNDLVTIINVEKKFRVILTIPQYD